MRIVSTVCDFEDGFEATTRNFALDGEEYSIDVCESHSESLTMMAVHWARHGRRRRHQPRSPRTSADRRHAAEVRNWVNENAAALGQKPVGADGRLPGWAAEAWARAHS